MKRAWVLFFTLFLLGGCSTTTVSSLVAHNNMNMMHLYRGMSKARALSVMKPGVRTCCCEKSSRGCSKVTVSNPSHTEIVEVSGKTFEVVYYLAGLKGADCSIGEDDMVPLVFESNKLIGWGKKFLDSLMGEEKSGPSTVQAAGTVKTAPSSGGEALQDSSAMEAGKAETIQAIQEAMKKAETEQGK